MSTIFYERQEGSLCRKHALNAYFGNSKISTDLFNKYIKEYDAIMRDLYNVSDDITAAQFDMVNANQTTLVGFILKEYNIYTRYIPLNTIYGTTLDLSFLHGNFIFVYNCNHIWGIRKVSDIWYTVDSLYGISEFNINSLTSMRDIGLLIPVIPCNEYYWNIKKIKSILIDNKIDSEYSLAVYFIKLHKQKLLLSELEVPFNMCIDILDFKKDNKKQVKYKQVADLITDSHTFIRKLYKGNLMNITVINESLPSLIFRLLELGKKKE